MTKERINESSKMQKCVPLGHNETTNLGRHVNCDISNCAGNALAFLFTSHATGMSPRLPLAVHISGDDRLSSTCKTDPTLVGPLHCSSYFTYTVPAKVNSKNNRPVVYISVSISEVPARVYTHIYICIYIYMHIHIHIWDVSKYISAT